MTLHCEQFGTTGPDIVLIHGWGWHGGVWDELARDLARTHRVWIVDLPGHGHSRDAQMPDSLEDLARTVAQSVPATASWVGWSLGGMAALTAARLGLAQRLVLLATTPRFVRDAGWEFGWSTEAFERFCADTETDSDGALQRFASLHLGCDAGQRSLLRQLRAELSRRATPHGPSLRAGLALLRTSDLRSQLSAIAAPTLIMHGAADQIVPAQAGEHVARALARAKFVNVAGAGHGLPLSHGEAISDLMEEFLRE